MAICKFYDTPAVVRSLLLGCTVTPRHDMANHQNQGTQAASLVQRVIATRTLISAVLRFWIENKQARKKV